MILVKLYAIAAALFLTFWLIVGMSLVYLAVTDAWPAILAAIGLMFYTKWSNTR